MQDKWRRWKGTVSLSYSYFPSSFSNVYSKYLFIWMSYITVTVTHLLHTDSSQWHCMDSKFGSNNRRRNYQWRQINLVDQKLVDGPNPNNRGKLFIPLILAFQPLLAYVSMPINRWLSPCILFHCNIFRSMFCITMPISAFSLFNRFKIFLILYTFETTFTTLQVYNFL